ncbi:MAG TPA: SGNH/GDSL hydrolase family protein, partial [Planctomycetota bacterium]|nr:SGNH/GDSL hydrolase family protein [Planctomycetota bacterium]
SFWVKGDGSQRFGGLQFIWNEDYAARYDYMFPIDSTEWRKITVAWRDLTPVLPGAKFLDAKNGPQPSKLSTLWFGKWWYWRDYGAHSFAIDEIRLEPTIATDDNLYLPSGDPLARVRAKVKAGQPITIVTMGDSLTDYRHWANKPVNWPTILKEKLGTATIVNPAIGGTELRQGIILTPRWLAEAPEPDLVTICYGGNDWNSGMRGEAFRVTLEAAVDRVRRLTKGKADILLMSTVPCVEMWRTRDELGAAVRAAAASRKTGLADTEKAFHAAGEGKPESLFCRDKVHLGPAGHALVAETIFQQLK